MNGKMSPVDQAYYFYVEGMLRAILGAIKAGIPYQELDPATSISYLIIRGGGSRFLARESLEEGLRRRASVDSKTP